MDNNVYLHKQGNSNLILLDFLRTGIISAYLRQAGCNAAEEDVSSHLCSNDLEQYLLNHNIPPVSADEVHQLCHQILAQCGQPNCPEAFVADLNEMCPWLLKDNYLISLLQDNPLALYTAMYVLVACSQNYVGQDAASGVRFVDEIYLPKEDMWQSLGISDISTFIRCWQSLNYYVCIEQNVYLPGVARDVLDLYSKNSIPSSVLLTQFSQMSVINGEIDDTEKDSTLFNPWVAWRRAAGMPQVEHGMTLEERAFIDGVMKLINCGVKATDLVNNLFYGGRRDILVEQNIMFPALQLDIGGAQRVLVVNPSPDFLVEYSRCDLTANRRTTFVVTDRTVVQAYAQQFLDQRKKYNFVAYEEFEYYPYLSNNYENLLPDYDYLIVTARDSNLKSFSKAFQWCSKDARILCFLPQTMMTAKGDENIIDVFEDNWIRVDSILELPSALSESGKRKKMLIRAHINEQTPSEFALVTTTHYTPDPPPPKQKKGGKNSTPKSKGKVTHYVIPDHNMRSIPYSMLAKRRTIKQMISYHDKVLVPQDTGATGKQHYNTDGKFPLTKDIDITLNLYETADGQYRARAYYKYKSARYGKSVRKKPNRSNSKESNRQLIRTEYYETDASCPEEIHARIKKWALKDDISNLITRDVEELFRSHPEKMTLHTAWYCNRQELISRYLTYDDNLAIQLFFGESRNLSDLPLQDVSEEKIMGALKLAAPSAEDDQKYRRLLDLIFRVAVSRGFLDTNPLTPTKTSMAEECKKAMRQLRDALTKESLEYDQIFKIVKFLLEPIGEQGVPRAVKESCWLVPLIRLCTGMPLREICALRVKDLHEIGGMGAYQLYVTRLVNDQNEFVPITNYRFIKQYRKVPCVSLLSGVLLQRLEYIQQQYGVTITDAMEQPLIYSEEPGIKRVGRKRATLHCTIRQARKVSVEALKKAEIPAKVIDLLDGEASFSEDLNTTRNDLFYSSFVHHANNICGISEGQLCYIVGRKGHNCFAEHYVDYRNDFVQLDIIQRLDRLWEQVCKAWRNPLICKDAEGIYSADHTITAAAAAGHLAHIDFSFVPETSYETGDITIRIECSHGVEGHIAFIP